MVDFLSFILSHSLFVNTISWIKYLWFLWLPLFLGYFFYSSWLSHTKASFLRNTSWILLEIKLPKDIYKSPMAIETILTSLYSTSSGSWWKRFFAGYLPHWYSLEIASINGRVHFFVYLQKSFRNLVESQIYAQFSDAEILEVVDYTYASNFENLDEWNLWASEFVLSKQDAYPIKTYIDFGLHETGPDEEQKISPLVSFLEFLGYLKQGEQVWFQIMIKGAGKKWIEDGKKLVDDLLGRNQLSSDDISEKKLSKREQEVISAIERNISKTGFETGIRIAYLAKRDIFDSVNIASLLGSMNHYNTQDLNSFKPSNSTSASPLGFILKNKREAKNKKVMLNAFRGRSYFYAPHKRQSFVFNTEELATIYHFPGRVAETPTFSRIQSKRSEPPINLPI